MSLLRKLNDDPLFKHALELLSSSEQETAKRYVENFVRELDEELERIRSALLVTLEPDLQGSTEPVEGGER